MARRYSYIEGSRSSMGPYSQCSARDLLVRCVDAPPPALLRNAGTTFCRSDVEQTLPKPFNIIVRQNVSIFRNSFVIYLVAHSSFLLSAHIEVLAGTGGSESHNMLINGDDAGELKTWIIKRLEDM